MGYDEEEKSRYEGQPIECYYFTLGSSSWSYTSAEKAISLPGYGDPFEPAPFIARHEDHGAEDSAGGIVLTVPRTLPCIAEFVSYAPPSPLRLLVIQAHRSLLGQQKTPFRGSVVSVGYGENGLAKLTCRPIMHELGRLIPRFCYQRQCNWPVYSAGCGLNPLDYEATVVVQAISGNVISGVGFGYLSDSMYRAGFVLWGSQRRFIMQKSGQDVTLMSPFIGLTTGQTVKAYAGCDKTEAACVLRANLDRHLGFARVPQRNPHTRRAF